MSTADAALPILPHGGVLVDRVMPSDVRDDFLARAGSLVRIDLDERTRADFELLATGAFSPLEGFVDRRDYRSIIENMRTHTGVLFPVPITLTVDAPTAAKIKPGEEVALWVDDRVVGSLRVSDVFPLEREREAEGVYRTTDRAHPGVRYLYERAKDMAVAGKVSLARRSIERAFPAHHRDPAETRRLFLEKGWKRIVGFQTRNPVHRAHEYLIKTALETVDGLLLHPIVGETKSDDVPAPVRMRCYEVLLEKYFPQDRAVLSVLPFAMRYAGPREAVLHAILRQNYGCTHFIVGRDHAGVGSYYGTYDAHRIFDSISSADLAITILFYEHTFYSKRFGEFGSTKTLPSTEDDRLNLSGTKVREMLARGEAPPPEFTRPEIAEILIAAYKEAREHGHIGTAR